MSDDDLKDEACGRISILITWQGEEFNLTWDEVISTPDPAENQLSDKRRDTIDTEIKFYFQEATIRWNLKHGELQAQLQPNLFFFV